MSNVNFACTSCGACCNSAPKLTFYDLLSLSDEFIFQAKHFTVMSTAKEPLPKERIRHLERLAHTVVLEEQNMAMFYWMSLGSLNKASYNGCPKLKNNLCSIYDKRPINCKNMPSHISYPPAMQETIIKFYKDNTSFKCDFSEDAPLYLKDGNFYNEVDENNYFNELNQTRTFTDRFLAYINLTPGALNNHFKNALKAMVSKTEMTTDIIIPLCVMVIEGWATPEQMEQVLLNQITLMKLDIKESKTLKLKADLKTVRFYESMIKVYEKAIKNKLFNNLNVSGVQF